MSEPQPPVQDTPAAPTAPTEPITTTSETPAPAGETAAAAAPTSPEAINPVKEEKIGKGEVLITSKAINEGVLNYKGPGLKGLIFSKKYFWLSEAPLEHSHLSNYLSNEKSTDIAHPNVAQATQSGKGLLFYAKRAEDKDHPQGILNIADMSAFAKGDFNDFSVKLHGKTHTFQALNKPERDGWFVALEPQSADFKANREALLATPGYKSALEKYSKPSAVGGVASKARSLSRPGKASKSRERVKDSTKDTPVVGGVTPAAPEAAEPTPAEPVAPVADTPAEPIAPVSDKAADTPADTTATPAPVEQKAEEAAAGAAIGAGAVGAAVIPDKKAEKEEVKEEKKEIKAEKKEEKKEDKAEKKASRSQSRGNKRTSIFGGLLGKKEDKKEEKKEEKAVKKEEKEEKKEIKAEEKAEKKAEAAEVKEEKKEIKAEEKAEKKEEKAEKKEEQAEEKAAKKEEKAAEKEDKKAGGLDAAAVASRVIAAPLSDKKAEKKESEVPAAGVSDSKAPVTGDGVEEATPAATTSKSPAPGLSSKASKRTSVFGGLFGKKEGAKSPSETAPAVPKKDDTPPVAPIAPQLENPVKTPTTDTTTNETAEAVTKASEPIAAEKALPEPTTDSKTPVPAATGSTPPSDKRRTSFFSGLGTKREKRGGATSGDELTDGEGKKSGGVGGLFRKASRAASKPVSSAKAATGVAPADPVEKTTAEKATEKTPETAPVPETAETAESKVDAAAVPLPKTEPGVEDVPNGTEAAPISAEKTDLAPADAGSNGIAAPEKSTPVEATA